MSNSCVLPPTILFLSPFASHRHCVCVSQNLYDYGYIGKYDHQERGGRAFELAHALGVRGAGVQHTFFFLIFISRHVHMSFFFFFFDDGFYFYILNGISQGSLWQRKELFEAKFTKYFCFQNVDNK